MQQARTTVAGYVRVSTEQQAGEGVSLDAQRTKLHAYAVAMDLDLVAVFEDAGLSAKSLARPGLQAALALLEDGEAAGLVVTKLDRLTRSVRDLGDLVDRYAHRLRPARASRPRRRRPVGARGHRRAHARCPRAASR
jgi:DNA invertase Pin-like site-specific DNA recombinase